jgi:predicted ATPase/DNA-binding XRE family transcriptional regulator
MRLRRQDMPKSAVREDLGGRAKGCISALASLAARRRTDEAHDARTLNSVELPWRARRGVTESQARSAFGLLLRRHRAAAGLSQEELAERAGLSRRAISDLERGVRRTPYPATARMLAHALGVDAAAQAALLTAGRETSAEAIRVLRQGASLAVGQPSPLIGRERELLGIEQRLLDSQVRLLTLAGPGGVGKTRLALALMQPADKHFADGARFVELSALRDAALVVPTIARALGIHDAGGQPMRQALIDALRATSLLLVLDNFEHVLDAAHELAEVLAACPDVKMLATSREPLRLRWEHLYLVPPLDVPGQQDLGSLDAVRAAPAVALFLDRARAADEGYALNEDNAQAIVTLCSRLDGLPLALELAAARIRSLSPQLLLDHLDQQLDLLVGVHDAPTRQQSLRATLDWSYDLLSVTERALFRRLSIFAGGCTLDAVEAVCTDIASGLLTALLTLVDKNLARQDDSADGMPRYRLLETVRVYALERLRAQDEHVAAATSHARYFLALAEQAAPLLDGPLQKTWLDLLEVEHNNMRVALRRLVHENDSDTGLRLAIALESFWATRGYVGEGRAWFDTFLQIEHAGSSSAVRAQALNCAGRLAGHDHDHLRAQSLHEGALALARELNDPWGIAAALRSLGDAALWTGNADAARAHYDEALSLTRAHGLHTELAETLLAVGDAAIDQLDYPTAQRMLEESLDLFRQKGNRRRVGRVQFSLGLVAFGRGDDKAAAAWLEQTLDLFSEINDSGGVAAATLYLGLALLRRGERARARALMVESLLISHGAGDDHGVAQALEALASLAAAEGDAQRALRLCAAAADVRTQLGLPLPEFDRVWLDAALATAGVVLGDRLEGAGGSTMALDSIVQYALEIENEPRPRT